MAATPTEPELRRFSTGATRDLDDGKLDYEGFFSARVLKRRAEYMHENRIQKDGNLRAADNWQKGIPMDAYMKSLWRHFYDVWSLYRGLQADQDMQTSLCAVLFNVEGMLHEILKEENEEKLAFDRWQDSQAEGWVPLQDRRDSEPAELHRNREPRDPFEGWSKSPFYRGIYKV